MKMEIVNLGSITNFLYGKGLPELKRKEGDVPVYGSSGIVNFHEKALVTGPGIIVGRKGNVGSVFYEKNNFYPIDTVYYIKNIQKTIDLKFLYYLLKTLRLDRLNSDAAVPGLNRERVLKLKILLPSLNSQKRIKIFLSTYDDLIDINQKRIHLLEQAARLLYREWFVYFRFSGHENVKIIDGIPEGWKKGKIRDIAKVQSGYAFKSSDWLDEGKPVIKIKNIMGDGSVNLDNCSCINEDVASIAKNYLLKYGDLLIAMTGATIGKVGLLSDKSRAIYLNQRVGKFNPKFEGAEIFLYCFLMSTGAQNYITNFAGGVAQANISASQIESIKINVAPRKNYNKFICITKPMFEEILCLRRQNQELAQARDLLLPRLMSGKINVSEFDEGSIQVESEVEKIVN